MIRRVTVVTAHLAFSVACSPAARSPAASSDAPPAGCDAPAYHRLDFWLGTWDVTSPRGEYEGTNVVTRALSGCAIEERWVDARGHRGDGLFYVDRASASWRQVWVTDVGPTKEKREVAGAPPGAIRFEGARDRTTLAPIDGGRVRQVIEALDGRASWTGIYARVPAQCDAPEHHQMDFWIGDWSVKVRSRVAPDKDEWREASGSNHVTSILNGCAIEERFTALGGPAGGTWSGRSHSTWVAAEKRWRQTWVDDGGEYLAFTGGMRGDEMVLVGEPRPNGRVMRMVFGEIGRDHLLWRWEASADGETTWRTMMRIEYTRLVQR